MTGRPGSYENDAISAILSRHEGPLLRYALRLTGDAETAMEVVQDTFVRFCERGGPAVADNGHAPWLFAVCRNRALDVLKRRRTQPDRAAVVEGAPPACPEESPGSVLERTEEHARILRLLAALPLRQQEAVRLKFQAGLSYREIGEVTNLTANNVGFLIHAAIKTLRERAGART